eukprot:GHVS01077057.1.p1 GENE.GHVS01077057.1~~GHVS01077057.1.p1  ORF type:complete len:327 (+),score=28.43 GHVS01077057.1:160-1140(+)
MKDWLLQLTVVLADGTILQTGCRSRKDSAGYDLVRLFCGSEGTLGVVTEATLRLATNPQYEAVAWCSFPSIEAACSSVTKLIQNGIQVGCAELLDAESMRVMNYTLNETFTEAPTILFKFSGTGGQVREAIEKAGKICTSLGGHKFSFAEDSLPPSVAVSNRAPPDGKQSSQIWAARKGLFWSAIAYRQTKCNDAEAAQWVPCITDVCVPISRLAEAVVATKRDLERQGLFFAPIFGHVGDGNYHVVIMFDAQKPEHIKGCEDACHRMAARAIAMGGTCTGEHGVGIGKRELLEDMYPSSTIEVMRRIKACLDPNGIMNPNKVFFL